MTLSASTGHLAWSRSRGHEPRAMGSTQRSTCTTSTLRSASRTRRSEGPRDPRPATSSPSRGLPCIHRLTSIANASTVTVLLTFSSGGAPAAPHGLRRMAPARQGDDHEGSAGADVTCHTRRPSLRPDRLSRRRPCRRNRWHRRWCGQVLTRPHFMSVVNPGSPHL